MLKHEPAEVTVQNAAEARVTPDEMIAALKALEDQRTNTVTIGSVVDELRLSDSPEQVWEQVKAQRTHEAAARTPFVQTVAMPLVTKRPRRRVSWWVIAVVSVVAWGALHNVSVQSTPSITTVSGSKTRVSGPETTISLTPTTTSPPIVTTSGQAITISGEGRDGTVPVEGKNVVVSGDGNTLTLQGRARSVTISGFGNDLQGDAPSVSNFTGEGNDVKWTQTK